MIFSLKHRLIDLIHAHTQGSYGSWNLPIGEVFISVKITIHYKDYTIRNCNSLRKLFVHDINGVDTKLTLSSIFSTRFAGFNYIFKTPTSSGELASCPLHVTTAICL